MLEYLDEQMPPETPLAFGLHPNAEIGFKLREAETFCTSLVQLQPREAGGEGGMSVEEKAKMVLDDLTERLPDQVGAGVGRWVLCVGRWVWAWVWVWVWGGGCWVWKDGCGCGWVELLKKHSQSKSLPFPSKVHT